MFLCLFNYNWIHHHKQKQLLFLLSYIRVYMKHIFISSCLITMQNVPTNFYFRYRPMLLFHCKHKTVFWCKQLSMQNVDGKGLWIILSKSNWNVVFVKTYFPRFVDFKTNSFHLCFWGGDRSHNQVKSQLYNFNKLCVNMLLMVWVSGRWCRITSVFVLEVWVLAAYVISYNAVTVS